MTGLTFDATHSPAPRPGPWRARPADAGRLALGVAVLALPRLPIRVTGTPDTVAARRTVRMLGARYVLQGVLGSTVHRPWLRTADTGVDLVHAGSMVLFAHFFPRHRRLAALSGFAALVFAALDASEASR